ncbi:MAG: thiamine phosphate synthase [Erysipelotrichaceae bacterium]
MSINNSYLQLYLVSDRSWLEGRKLYDVLKQCLDYGVTCIQLREKDLSYDKFLEEAKLIQKLCKAYHVPFIINDNVELAIKINADGVHIGQNDIDVSEARKLLGPNKILGVSAQNLEQALEAEKNGASYLGVGAIFPTNTKNDANDVSINTLSNICNSVKIPTIAIGGISLDNIKLLSKTSISGVAVVSAILSSDNIPNTIKSFNNILREII